VSCTFQSVWESLITNWLEVRQRQSILEVLQKPQYMEWELHCTEVGKLIWFVGLVHDFQESDDYALELAMAHEWFSPTILRGVDNCREAVSFCPFLGCRNVNCKYKCDRNVGCKFCIIVEAWTFGWIIIYLYTPTVRSWRCQWLVEFYANCFYI